MTKHATFLLLLLGTQAVNAFAAKPNVILVMTDDQGYGDLSCHGNPVLKTPNLDQLYDESVRLTDFHVSPFCTPTRAALMTGRYPARTGAYRTSSGRTMLHTDERTVANLFAEAGYATGMVGKWHLGDNAPHRPQDRGFQDVVWHRCGGVGQASDYFGNDYFDDTYERNGKFEKFAGYCTDVWFAEATRFVERNQERPFFLYLATNAPHGPYRVLPEWARPYAGKEGVANANFYGMIANIDHNMGLLRKRLAELELADNTILIFMTDNGTSAGAKFNSLDSEPLVGFNAGMRGKKSSVYEGGHRVPFFIHWPAGGLLGGREVSSLSAHMDVLPTLAELCGISVPDRHASDGVSLAAQLKGSNVPARDHLVVQFQGGPFFRAEPKPWEYSCVARGRWRLINGRELYDLDQDPAQRNDIASKHSGTVQQLRALYLPFWESVSPRMSPVSIDLGNPANNPTVLCSQDWYMPQGNPPWNFGQIGKLPRVAGPWMVNVRKAGRYRIALRQWPAEASKTLKAVRAKLRIAGAESESMVAPGSKTVDFELALPAGKTKLETWLFDEQDRAGGAYFTEVELLSPATQGPAREAADSGRPNSKSLHQPGELWEHLSSADDFAETRYLTASFQKANGRGLLKLRPVKDHERFSAWVSIPPPEEGWDLKLKATVEATVRNSGEEDVDVVLWAVSSHGWDAVGSQATLKPGQSQALRCDLRQTFPDGTPKLDPGRIKEIRLMVQRARLGAAVEVTGLVAAGAAEPWKRPANRLDVPEMEEGQPAPGRRVRYQLPADVKTSVYSTLYLPPGWTQGRSYPVVVEYPGNIFYRAGGCWSTGRPEQCSMGYGITKGQGAIWVCLPFVDRERSDVAENAFGSNAGQDTTEHALAAVADICANWGGDRDNLFICGFSRGSIACGYIGLANEEIGSLWKGIIGCQHYDGSKWNQSNIEGAVERARRFQGAAIFQVDNDQQRYRPVQEATRPEVNWTWRKSGLGYHATAMFLDDRPLMKELRPWFGKLAGTAGESSEPER